MSKSCYPACKTKFHICQFGLYYLFLEHTISLFRCFLLKKYNALFQSCLSDVTNDVKAEVDLSFAIVDRIDLLLKEKGMTQRELAEALGKKEAEVSRWMRGTHNFTIRTLAKISNVLGTQIINVSN